jgi:hypothetical protein
LQANLIMPEPTHFLNKKFPPVAIIRPTSTKNCGAVASLQSFVNNGLFVGQKNPEFLRVMFSLAEEADEARRRF